MKSGKEIQKKPKYRDHGEEIAAVLAAHNKEKEKSGHQSTETPLEHGQSHDSKTEHEV